jgi:hypothetical protein
MKTLLINIFRFGKDLPNRTECTELQVKPGTVFGTIVPKQKAFIFKGFMSDSVLLYLYN